MIFAWLFSVMVFTGLFAAWNHVQSLRHRAVSRRLEVANAALEVLTEQMHRGDEDTYVLKALLLERGYLAQNDLDTARERLIEAPARQRHSLPAETRGSVH